MRYCNQCGLVAATGTRFCTSCGSQMPEALSVDLSPDSIAREKNQAIDSATATVDESFGVGRMSHLDHVLLVLCLLVLVAATTWTMVGK